MNFPRIDTDFNDNDFKNFKYGRRDFKIFRKIGSEVGECSDIGSSEDLTRWIQEYDRSMQQECRQGIVAVIFSRGGELSTPSSLPIKMNEFEKLIELLHIHPAIVRTIRREVASFYRVQLRNGTIVYTARTCSTWRNDDIALSSTYLPHEDLNLSIFYGCNEEQSRAIVKGLENAGDAICHPMLPPGLLVELDRDRLATKIGRVIDQYVAATEAMCCACRDLESARTGNSLYQNRGTEQCLDLCNEDRDLANGIRIVMRQVSSMIQHIDELDAPRSTWKRARAHLESGSDNQSRSMDTMYISDHFSTQIRIRERLVEIAIEYEQRLEQCRMVLDDLGFTTQRTADLATIQIALSTKRDSTQMRSVALVTMIFLPVTSVASIFSMGVFNWTANTEQSVLTFYFWVYVAIAGGLTAATVGMWWVLTRRRNEERSLARDEEKAA